MLYYFSSGSGCRFKQYCSNKQIQNKQFKKISIIKTENKGYGICAVEDIPKYVVKKYIHICISIHSILAYIYTNMSHPF